MEKVGLRAVAAFGPSRPPWPREYTYWRNGRRIERQVSLEETFEATDETIGRWNRAHQGGRVKMWVAVSRILNENTPYIWLYRVTWAIASTDQVHGYGASANGTMQTVTASADTAS